MENSLSAYRVKRYDLTMSVMLTLCLPDMCEVFSRGNLAVELLTPFYLAAPSSHLERKVVLPRAPAVQVCHALQLYAL